MQVVALVPARNEEAAAHRRDGYRIAPSEVLGAHRRARERGLAIVGFYHSHPDRPAVPSVRDRREAWPGASYLIVAVGRGGDEDVRSWRLADDRSRLVEQTLVAVSASRLVPRPFPNGGRS